jgi:glycosyltransferase involved in cell wall biosynthesis
MPELVSILIPAYNADKWIADTINSALSQTWAKKEIIIVDDGSTDDTLSVAKTFESKIVKVIAQKNTGACGARNKALSLAQGSYIQWLDADDLLHPEKIASQLREAEDGLTARVLLTCKWGMFFYCTHRASMKPDSLWQNMSAVEWIMTKLSDNVWMNPAVWLVSRRLTDLAGPWDERLSISGDDDGEYICRVVAASEGVKFVPEAMCYYRIGTVGSLNWNMGKSREKLKSLFLSLNLSVDHLLSLENSEKTRRAGVRILQTWLPLFYPEHSELLDEMDKRARALGGSLSTPKISWKYYPVEVIFGLKTARNVMCSWNAFKLSALKNWDGLLYKAMERRRKGSDTTLHKS